MVNESSTERFQILLDKLSDSFKNLDKTSKKSLENLIRDYNSSFAVTELELTQTKITAVDINTGDSLPIKSKPRPIAPQFKEKVTQMIEQFLRQGVIEPSNSPWCSPITLVGKKDGSIRFCIDFRRLNSVTIKDAFPIPNIDSILASFANKKFFT